METVNQQLYQPDAFTRSGGLWPVKSGQTWADTDYSIGPRVIAYYNLHFVIEGHVELHVADRVVSLSRGDAFAMFPDTVYRYRLPERASKLEMSWVSFDGPQVGELMRQSGFSPDNSYGLQVMSTELSYVLRQIHSDAATATSQQVGVIAWLYRLFSLLIRPDPPEIPARQEVWLARSIDYMHMHYTERISVQDIADHLSIHRSYFSKVFTAHTGQSPSKYLQKLRMEKAGVLLRTAELSIEEIALTLGYSDAFTFTHAFKHYWGLPPGQWRSAEMADSPTSLPAPSAE